eukprot:TRINITY_DN1956_c0_g2_i2.p2 TRINITY_DN1956_c0_g2~~TRINITY_DN1956_c0_g2_i2.p2  ORF type:complete len:307 (-),score=129.12 TRINITY_DN1956_c0_g2_i2:31-951(-)
MRYSTRRSALSGIVQSLLITRHMLFVGFSLKDDNFHRIIDEVRRSVRPDSEDDDTEMLSSSSSKISPKVLKIDFSEENQKQTKLTSSSSSLSSSSTSKTTTPSTTSKSSITPTTQITTSIEPNISSPTTTTSKTTTTKSSPSKDELTSTSSTSSSSSSSSLSSSPSKIYSSPTKTNSTPLATTFKGRKFGTQLVLHENPLTQMLWDQDVYIVTMSDSPSDNPARKLEIFLDYLLSLTTSTTSFLLNHKYNALLSEGQRQLKQSIVKFISDLPPSAMETNEFQLINKLFVDLGWQKKNNDNQEDPII